MGAKRMKYDTIRYNMAKENAKIQESIIIDFVATFGVNNIPILVVLCIS